MHGAFDFQLSEVIMSRGCKESDIELWNDYCRKSLWYSYEDAKAVGCVILQRLVSGDKAKQIQRAVDVCWNTKKNKFLSFVSKTKVKKKVNPGNRSGGNKVNGGSRGGGGNKICRGFNLSPPCLFAPCRFKHTCTECGASGHGASQCKKVDIK